jgi:hypothetical protein
MAEFLEDVTVKLLGIVDSYLSGHSVAAYYVLPEKSSEPSVAMLTKGFTSIHLVKYFTTTTAYM